MSLICDDTFSGSGAVTVPTGGNPTYRNCDVAGHLKIELIGSNTGASGMALTLDPNGLNLSLPRPTNGYPGYGYSLRPCDTSHNVLTATPEAGMFFLAQFTMWFIPTQVMVGFRDTSQNTTFDAGYDYIGWWATTTGSGAGQNGVQDSYLLHGCVGSTTYLLGNRGFPTFLPVLPYLNHAASTVIPPSLDLLFYLRRQVVGGIWDGYWEVEVWMRNQALGNAYGPHWFPYAKRFVQIGSNFAPRFMVYSNVSTWWDNAFGATANAYKNETTLYRLTWGTASDMPEYDPANGSRHRAIRTFQSHGQTPASQLPAYVIGGHALVHGLAKLGDKIVASISVGQISETQGASHGTLFVSNLATDPDSKVWDEELVEGNWLYPPLLDDATGHEAMTVTGPANSTISLQWSDTANSGSGDLVFSLKVGGAVTQSKLLAASGIGSVSIAALATWINGFSGDGWSATIGSQFTGTPSTSIYASWMQWQTDTACASGAKLYCYYPRYNATLFYDEDSHTVLSTGSADTNSNSVAYLPIHRIGEVSADGEIAWGAADSLRDAGGTALGHSLDYIFSGIRLKHQPANSPYQNGQWLLAGEAGSQFCLFSSTASDASGRPMAWQRTLVGAVYCHEPYLIECDDGTLLAFVRPGSGSLLMQAYLLSGTSAWVVDHVMNGSDGGTPMRSQGLPTCAIVAGGYVYLFCANWTDASVVFAYRSREAVTKNNLVGMKYDLCPESPLFVIDHNCSYTRACRDGLDLLIVTTRSMTPHFARVKNFFEGVVAGPASSNVGCTHGGTVVGSIGGTRS